MLSAWWLAERIGPVASVLVETGAALLIAVSLWALRGWLLRHCRR
jgi:hypothetical protein